jgi:hypothetical protein
MAGRPRYGVDQYGKSHNIFLSTDLDKNLAFTNHTYNSRDSEMRANTRQRSTVTVPSIAVKSEVAQRPVIILLAVISNGYLICVLAPRVMYAARSQ